MILYAELGIDLGENLHISLFDDVIRSNFRSYFYLCTIAVNASWILGLVYVEITLVLRCQNDFYGVSLDCLVSAGAVRTDGGPGSSLFASDCAEGA